MERGVVIHYDKACPCVERARRRVLLVAKFVDEERTRSRRPHLSGRAVVRSIYIPLQASRIKLIGIKEGIACRSVHHQAAHHRRFIVELAQMAGHAKRPRRDRAD